MMRTFLIACSLLLAGWATALAQNTAPSFDNPGVMVVSGVGPGGGPRHGAVGAVPLQALPTAATGRGQRVRPGGRDPADPGVRVVRAHRRVAGQVFG